MICLEHLGTPWNISEHLETPRITQRRPACLKILFPKGLAALCALSISAGEALASTIPLPSGISRTACAFSLSARRGGPCKAGGGSRAKWGQVG